MKKIICVIPARLQSTRLREKVLCLLAGKPLLQWVYEAAKRCQIFDRVVIAVDSKKVFDVAQGFGAEVFFTPESCASGTDRLIALKKAAKIEGEIFVNWQGDEPFLKEAMIEDLLQSIDDGSDVWTLKKKILNLEEVTDSHTVKVVTTTNGEALYFSRQPIGSFKHIGIYAYTADALDRIAKWPRSPLEIKESLEQLRFLENGLKIRVHTTEHECLGIDTPEDLARAEKLLLSTV